MYNSNGTRSNTHSTGEAQGLGTVERDRGAGFARGLAVGALERGLLRRLGFCVLGPGGGRGCKPNGNVLATAERGTTVCSELTLLGALGVGLLGTLRGGHFESVVGRMVVKLCSPNFSEPSNPIHPTKVLPSIVYFHTPLKIPPSVH